MKIKCKIKNVIPSSDYWIFAFLWLIIMLSKPIQLVAFVMIALVLLYRTHFKIYENKVSFLMILLFGTHIVAIIYNVLVINGQTERIPAAINTALLWLLTAIFYAYYSNGKSIDIDYIGKLCCLNLIILFIGALITIYMYYFCSVTEMSLFGRILYGTTYLEGIEKTKFFGLNDFSNMNLFYIMLMMALSMNYIKKRGFLLQVVMLLISSIEVFLIHSRSGMILFTASLIYSYLELIPKKCKKLVWLTVIVFAVLIVGIEFRSLWAKFINKIIYGNESSTSFRILLLTTSIDEAWKTSPILGMGIKRYLYYGYPLGSHSTYVGFFYKTGFIGLVLGTLIFVIANYKCLHKWEKHVEMRIILGFIISFIVLFAIEDVDGSNWSSILYFSALAIWKNYKKKESSSNEYQIISNISSTVSRNRL